MLVEFVRNPTDVHNGIILITFLATMLLLSKNNRFVSTSRSEGHVTWMKVPLTVMIGIVS